MVFAGGSSETVTIATVIFAAVVVPLVFITGKRFHDRNKSAWWCLLLLIPLVGTIWLVVECGFFVGDAGPNRFGEATGKTRYG